METQTGGPRALKSIENSAPQTGKKRAKMRAIESATKSGATIIKTAANAASSAHAAHNWCKSEFAGASKTA